MAIDWSGSMQQTFEYYKVDPISWRDISEIDTFTESTIKWDADSDTLGSASFATTEDIGEQYIRAYLIAIQNGIKNKICLGTFLGQTPSDSFDGRNHKLTIDGYTPLHELSESSPPLGYTVMNSTTIMDTAAKLIRDNCRVPYIPVTENTKKLYSDFVANTDDTWLSFIKDLIANADYSFGLDETGQIIFKPYQNLPSLSPVWEFTDDNSSILYPSITVERDLYNVPNVVEVCYSKSKGYLYGLAVNDDPGSITSTVSRGRKIVKRITNPSIVGNPTQEQIQKYAENQLRDLSTLEYKVSFTHGYCPARIGDCIKLNYEAAGLVDVKAKIISQEIKCTTGCEVADTAVYTKTLWG